MPREERRAHHDMHEGYMEEAQNCSVCYITSSMSSMRSLTMLFTTDGNPRKIKEVESHQVSDMSEAETRAHHAVEKWNTKATYGGGSEWFYVTQNEYGDFHKKFNDAVKKKKSKPSTSLVSLLKALMHAYDI